MIQWIYFPKSDAATVLVTQIVDVFGKVDAGLKRDKSDSVLRAVRPGLEEVGSSVETGKTAGKKIRVPVLLGRNEAVSKAFEVDAWHKKGKFVLEVEAGRGYLSNQFLKDLFHPA